MPKFLYADSEPFPLDYDFLSTLRGFVECGASCLGAISRVRSAEAQLLTEQVDNERTLAAFDRLAEDMGKALDRAVRENPMPPVVAGMGADIRASIGRLAAEQKASVERRLAASASEVDGREAEAREIVRDALRRFFLNETITVEDAHYRLTLNGDAYSITCDCQHPCGVSATYELRVDDLPQWQRPRKVGDLVGEFEVQVGMKKKLLRRDLTRELAHLEDRMIVEAEVGEGRASVTLRRKPDDAKHEVVLTMQRDQSAMGTEIRRSEGTKESIFPAAPADLDKMTDLWAALREAVRHALEHKGAVLEMRLDGEELASGDRAAEMVQRYVDLYQPLVSEIARRSPSPHELSLKVQREDGRREELYLRRDELSGLLRGLEDGDMAVFAPLDFIPEIEVEVD